MLLTKELFDKYPFVNHSRDFKNELISFVQGANLYGLNLDKLTMISEKQLPYHPSRLLSFIRTLSDLEFDDIGRVIAFNNGEDKSLVTYNDLGKISLVESEAYKCILSYNSLGLEVKAEVNGDGWVGVHEYSHDTIGRIIGHSCTPKGNPTSEFIERTTWHPDGSSTREFTSETLAGISIDLNPNGTINTHKSAPNNQFDVYYYNNRNLLERVVKNGKPSSQRGYNFINDRLHQIYNYREIICTIPPECFE